LKNKKRITEVVENDLFEESKMGFGLQKIRVPYIQEASFRNATIENQALKKKN